MILWMILAAMTVGAVLVIIVPLTRQRGEADPEHASDTAVYKDQLNEVKSDFERGLLGQTEAEAARAEIARRLLKSASSHDAKAASDAKASGVIRKLTSGFALACIPGFALGIYVLIGSPGLPDQPFAERRPVVVPPSLAGDDETRNLIARAEQHLADNPDDIRGWQILAPIYTKQRRFNDASFALKKIMVLSGNSSKATADYGESLVIGNRGDVGPQALEVFNNLLKTSPKMPRPLHYVALADAQAGRLKQAAAKWRELLAANPQDVPWRTDIERLAARAEGKEPPQTDVSSLPPPGTAPAGTPQASQLPALSSEQMQAGNAMDASSRQQMIEGMVKRLSDRLAQNGGSVAEWVRLARTQKVLGKMDAANSALASAEAAYGDNPAALGELKDARAQLEIGRLASANETSPVQPSSPPPTPVAPRLPQGSRPPALSEEQMRAAGSMDANSRQQMIAGMVKRLSDRLAQGGGSIGEWVRLARAYQVMGNDESAKAALASAETAYADQPESLEELKNARMQLGIEP